MSDDLFTHVLGGEEDKSDAATPETPAGAEAFAAAIAAIASRQDPGVARETEEFLANYPLPHGSAMSAKLEELRARGFQCEGFREGYEARDALIRRGEPMQRSLRRTFVGFYDAAVRAPGMRFRRGRVGALASRPRG